MLKITLIQGNVADVLKTLPDESVDCIITSPPYWGLRDYGKEAEVIWDGEPNCEHDFLLERKKDSMDRDIGGMGSIGQPRVWEKRIREEGFCIKCGAWKGQLGLEPTPELYIKHMLQITGELKRVLKKTGTFWLNIGDTYCGSMGKGKYDFPSKCLAMIPERLALEMIEQGWILRNKIIWYKPNHLPSSAKDRFTNTWEYVFLFSKSKKYYFDLDAVREPLKISTIKRVEQWIRNDEDNKDFSKLKQSAGNPNPKFILQRFVHKFKTKTSEQIVWAGLSRNKEGFVVFRPNLPSPRELVDYLRKWKGNHTFKEIAEATGLKENSVSHWFTYPESSHGFSYPSKENWLILKKILGFDDTYDEAMLKEDIKPSYIPCNILGKNPGDLWEIPTQPFPEAHFAVYPEKLVERAIKAGCPKEVCKKCGKPKERITNLTHEHITIGWKNPCNCNAEFEPGTVLDPFAGSGTTGLVAIKERVNCIMVEIKPEYCEMIERRLNLKGLQKLGTINYEFIPFEKFTG